MKLQESTYFDTIEQAMRQQGFSLLARTTVDNTDHRYHVTASTARSTGMFFYIPQRALIIQMVYTESDFYDRLSEESGLASDNKGVCGHWSITFHKKFLPAKNIFSRLRQQGVDADDWNDTLNTLPLYWRYPEKIGDLTYLGNSMYEGNYGENGAIESETLASLIGEVVWKIADWLDYSFNELQVTSFPPHYTFPDCTETFWERFDRKKLHRIVQKPWGSTNLRR